MQKKSSSNQCVRKKCKKNQNFLIFYVDNGDVMSYNPFCRWGGGAEKRSGSKA